MFRDVFFIGIGSAGMLIDDVTIKAEAGDGGRGAVAFNKNLLALGPAGGSGGRGGSIYAEGVSDLGTLGQFRYEKDVRAQSGGGGRPQFCDGIDGSDRVLKIPVGTVVHNLTKGYAREIVRVGERIRIARGGRGGWGNFHFRSSVNTTPREFEEGTPGERFDIRFELKLIADIGLIGLPNAGKSSLLNELTRASAKVANYPFTTLEPNLGVHYGLILADIPGLIEGASHGKGLGIKFLRHVERTRILFHLVAADSAHPVKDYRTVKNELKKYSKELAQKKEYVFLSKSDTASPAELKKKLVALKKAAKNVLPLSIHDWDSMEKVKKILAKIQAKK